MAAISPLIVLILFVIIGVILDKTEGDLGSLFFLITILYLPLFVLALCSGFILNWLFKNWYFTKRALRSYLAFLITSAVSTCYVMITWLVFGDFSSLIRESIAIILISISVVTLTEFLTLTKKRFNKGGEN
ncbi:MAG: hypothetical protein MK066_03270 [Crocinitomicaceae bacterium]|nr:hypothetical protein [Crocinitomicaceae bacterium]